MKVFTKCLPLLVDKKHGTMRVLLPTLCALLLLSQCGKKNTPEVPPGVEVTITAEETSVTLPAKGGDYEVKITSSGDWNVKEEVDWLEAMKVDNTTLKVTCEENTGDERSDKVTATIEDQSAEITVIQSRALIMLMNREYAFPGPSAQESAEIHFGEALSFDTKITHWWVTAEDGEAASTIDGLTSVSYDGSTDNRQDTGNTTLTLAVTENTELTARVFRLELRGGTSTVDSENAAVPFTVTQPGVVATFSNDTYTIAPDANPSVSVDFTGNVQFNSNISHWWITAENGAPANEIEGIMSVSHDGSTDNRQVTGTPSFTMEVTENTELTERVFRMELHGGTDAGDEEGTVPFIVTQESRVMILNEDTYEIAADAHPDVSIDFSGNAAFKTGITHWWVTAEDGSPASSLTGITSVSHDGSTGNRQTTGTLSFTMEVTHNPDFTDRVFMLAVHGGTSTGDAEGSVPFTVTQEGSMVVISDNTYSIPADANPAASVDFESNIQLNSEMTHWWITAEDGAPAKNIEGIIEVSHDGSIFKRVNKERTAFTLTVSKNPMNSDQNFRLALHVGMRLGSSQGFVPFTVTQDGSAQPATVDLSPAMLTLTVNQWFNTLSLTVTEGVLWRSEVTYPAGTPDWIHTVTPENGVGTGSAVDIHVGYNGNFETANISAVITFIAGNTTTEFSVEKPPAPPTTLPPGRIPVSTLEQLNAIRHDLNSDGRVDNPDNTQSYTDIFPNLVYSPGRYTGYELTQDLNFNDVNSYSSGALDQGWSAGEEGSGWNPIGGTFTGTFDGGGHTISHLFINRSGGASLFIDVGGTIQRLGLVDPNLTVLSRNVVHAAGLARNIGQNAIIRSCYVSGGTIRLPVNSEGGGLVVDIRGTVTGCYVSNVTIHVGSSSTVGGLASFLYGSVTGCYVSGTTIRASSHSEIGGLVGHFGGRSVRACYVSDITITGVSGGSLFGRHLATNLIASYAGGTGENYTNLKGGGNGTITNSYYQASTSTGNGKTENELKTPTGYTGIYANWNDLNGDGTPDTNTYWDFGDANQYPVLNIDFNGDGNAADDITRQRN